MSDRRATARGAPDRRAAPRPAPLRRGGLHVETLDLRAAVAQRAAWSALARRSLEPNAFYEPAFLLPALNAWPKTRQPLTLVVRKRREGRMRLIGLLPLAPAPSRFALGPSQAFLPPGAPCGVPLVDHDHARDALAGMLAYAGAGRGVGGLLLRRVVREGAVAILLSALTAAARPAPRAFNPAPLPMLSAGAETWPAPARAQAGALAAQGEVAFAAHEGEAALDALERGFALEGAGRGFDRQAARAASFVLAREGRCVAGELTLDGAAVGCAVAALSGDLATIWMSAGAPALARLAPEALARLHLGEALLRRAGLARVVCASDLPPLWPAGAELVDLLLPGLRDEADGGARGGVGALLRRFAGKR